MTNVAREHESAYIAACHERSLDGICRNMTDSIVLSPAEGTLSFPDLAAWRTHHESEWRAFPDARFDVTGSWTSDYACTIEGTWRGTMENQFSAPGMPPFPPQASRRSCPAPSCSSRTSRGSGVAGCWNRLTAMSQLGLMPGAWIRPVAEATRWTGGAILRIII